MNKMDSIASLLEAGPHQQMLKVCDNRLLQRACPACTRPAINN